MASITKSIHHTDVQTATGSNFYTRLIQKLEFSYFGLISMTIAIGSCLGGIAAMYILQDNGPIWQLCLNIYISMANNVAAIGQAPTKWVVNLFTLSILTNLALILIHVL